MVKRSMLYKKITHIKHNLDRLKGKQNLTKDDFISDFDACETVLLNLQQAGATVVIMGH